MSALPISGAPSEPGEDALVLAGLWSFALQTLVGRAAHELNNVLNGALVNLEVVKARALAGRDAGAVTDFAAAASGQLEETAALAGALVALSRPPRGTPDVAAILGQAVALLAPSAARDGVVLTVEGPRSCPVGGDPVAARLAVVAPLLAAVASAAATAETAGADPAREQARHLRCSTRSDDRPVLEIAPRYGTVLSAALRRGLVRAGIDVDDDSDALRLALPAPATT